MQIYTTYSVKIKHYNNIFKDTVIVYRHAVDYLIKVCLVQFYFMVFLGVYYTLLDFGGVGAGGYTLTLFLFRRSSSRCSMVSSFFSFSFVTVKQAYEQNNTHSRIFLE